VKLDITLNHDNASRAQRRSVSLGPQLHWLPHHPAMLAVRVPGALRAGSHGLHVGALFVESSTDLLPSPGLQAFNRREAALHDLSQGDGVCQKAAWVKCLSVASCHCLGFHTWASDGDSRTYS
jgi:hypothetical protein